MYNVYIISVTRRNDIVLQSEFLSTRSLSVILIKPEAQYASKIHTQPLYPIPNCLHRQPENLPIAPSFGSADSSPNILPPWRDAECLWSVEEGSETECKRKLADRRMLRMLQTKRQTRRQRKRERERSCVFMHLSERAREREKERRKKGEREKKRDRARAKEKK